MKDKPLTEKECISEIERVARIVCFEKTNDNEIKFIKQTMTTSLLQLDKIRKDKAERKAEAERVKYCRKYGADPYL